MEVRVATVLHRNRIENLSFIFPPGISKWNKIKHHLFSCISKKWRAKPLITIEVIVNLIANATTQQGLKVHAKKDENAYEKSIKISDKELAKINTEKIILKENRTILSIHNYRCYLLTIT